MATDDPPPQIPNALMPLYDEALTVADASPASACALLRILIHSLLKSSGRSGRNIARDVNDLVSTGADVGVLRAFDVVSMTDNEARKPAELSLANGHSDVQNLTVFVHVLARSLH